MRPLSAHCPHPRRHLRRAIRARRDRPGSVRRGLPHERRSSQKLSADKPHASLSRTRRSQAAPARAGNTFQTMRDIAKQVVETMRATPFLLAILVIDLAALVGFAFTLREVGKAVARVTRCSNAASNRKRTARAMARTATLTMAGNQLGIVGRLDEP